VLTCPQLVMTVGLLAVVVYLYTVVAFNFFRKFYNKSEDEDEPDMKCDDMMTVSPSPMPVRKLLNSFIRVTVAVVKQLAKSSLSRNRFVSQFHPTVYPPKQ
jgi:hypothetical protein